MKAKMILFTAVLVFCCIYTTTVTMAQRNVPVAVNDTVNITPYIPVTVNLLANDTIPAGDSVGIILLEKQARARSSISPFKSPMPTASTGSRGSISYAPTG